MAKKAAKSKSKKAAKRATTQPKEPVTVPVQSVVQFVKMLIRQERIDEFEDGAKTSNAIVILDEESAEFVRKFLARNKPQLRRAMAVAIVDPCPGNPFDC